MENNFNNNSIQKTKINSSIEIETLPYKSFSSNRWIVPTLKDLLKLKSEISLNGKENEDSIILLIDDIIEKAISLNASDIHFEQEEGILVVRYRIDGVLKKFFAFSGEKREKMISRLKLMASMDITETRRPQDGRIKKNIKGEPIDIRVSSLPTAFGERLVLRILDTSNVELNIEKIGIDEDLLTILKKNLKKNGGLILVTGPTGSGKTTTLYSALNYIKNETLNIMTVEDPIEYKLEGISQTQVSPEIDFTFANSLRSILRQDPDVILIGEIRDSETLSIALRSAVTGHLVLSTLHTNSALSSIARLRDLGAETFMLVSALNLIIAQRLLRKLCPDCKYFETNIQANGKEVPVWNAKGCKKCNGTGYVGRIPVFEYVELDDNIKEMILKNASDKQIYNYLKKEKSFESLSDKILKLLSRGETSIYEAEKMGVF